LFAPVALVAAYIGRWQHGRIKQVMELKQSQFDLQDACNQIVAISRQLEAEAIALRRSVHEKLAAE
jgi:hypothetical protein